MVKLKSFVPACLCLLFFSVKSQYNTNFLNYSNTGRSVSVNLDVEAGSNGMSSLLVDKLVYGGYISDDMKKESSKHLKGVNNFGLYLNYDVSAFLKGGKKYDFLIGVKNQEILNASFTKDVYNLVFYGNQYYKGGTANLSNCNLNALRFQEAKFGAVLNNIDSAGRIGISISFLKGEQLFYIKTNKNSSLYTSADGSQLILNSDFSVAISDTNNKQLSGFNGVGASADIFFETSYKSRVGKRSILSVNVNNIGFIHWLNNSVQYSSDSTFQFSGYTVRSIADLKDSTLNRINKDSLLRDLSNAHKENFNINIPTNLLLINKIYFGNQKFCLTTGFRHIFNANYKLYLFAEPEYKYRNVTFALHTGYGGYVRFNIGAWLMWSTKKWFVRFGSNSLQGYVLPRSSFGQGLFFSLAKKLK